MINELLLTMSLLSNTITYVYTPKGSRVTAYANSELSALEINNYNRISDAYFATDVRLANSSSKYNGHSFCFYKQRINNNYWIDSPYAYLSDGSYIEVPYSNIQPRDRIVYYNSNNEIVHSGVVRGTTGQTPNGVCGYANTVWVQSKWGYYGLYEHRGDQCPYTSLVSGGIAVSIKFYRYNISHSHRYTYTVLDSNYHYASCDCGDIIVEHTFEQQQIFPLQSNEYEPNYIPNYVCTYCGYTSSTGGIL